MMGKKRLKDDAAASVEVGDVAASVVGVGSVMIMLLDMWWWWL